MTDKQIAPTEATKPRSEAAGVMKRSSRFFVDPDTIVIDPAWNVRIDMGDIEELADSIEAELKRDPESGGLIHELGLRRINATHPLSQGGKKHFVVQWGHRRTTAIHLLRKRGVEFKVGVPAKLVDKAQDVQHATIQLFIENSNKPLMPLEEAAAYKRLRDGFPDADPPIPGMTVKEICAAVGRKAMHVGEMLALLDAPEEVKEAVAKGEIGKTQAKNIARHARGDAETQKKLTEVAKKANKGDKAAKKELDKGLDASKRAKAAKKGRVLKMRALSDEELNKLGLDMQAQLKKHLKQAGKPDDFDLKTWVTKDDKLALAATFGAIMALRAAAGIKTDLEF